MAICAVIDLETKTQINTIVATELDLAPQGCMLIEIPEGYYWDNDIGSLMKQVEESI